VSEKNNLAERQPMSVEIKNYYNLIPAGMRTGGGLKYPNYDKIKIKVPMRMLIVGGTGSGKTNIAINLIKLMACFTQIFLIAKDLEEPLYQFLIKSMERAGKKAGKQIIFYSSDISEVPDVDEIDRDESTLFIFDDLVSESIKAQRNISDLFIRGRKRTCSVIYITQSYFQVPPLIRKNCDYIALRQINTTGDLTRICKEYNLGDMSPAQLLALYKRITSKGLTNFLLIDLNTNNQALKFRENFSPIG
jgi:hypothetical protein